MADNKFSIEVNAKTGAAQAELKKLGDQAASSFDRARVSFSKFQSNVASGWRSIKGAWVEIAAGAVTLKKAYDLAFDAAKYQERQQAFANLAASHGESAQRIIDGLKAMSGQTVDTMTIMEKAGTAITMGIDPAKLTKIMEIARATTKVTGQSVEQAFSDLSLALARVSPMILDNLGLQIKLGEANKAYAAAMKITNRELTDQEKKQAFVNAALEKGQELIERVGQKTDTQAERFQRYVARWRNAMKYVGKVVLTVGQGVEYAFTAAGMAINRMVAKAAQGLAWLATQIDKIPTVDVGNIVSALRGVQLQANMASNLGLKHMDELWATMKGNWEEAVPTIGKINRGIEDQGTVSGTTAKELGKYVDEFERWVDNAMAIEQKRAEGVSAVFMVGKKAEMDALKKAADAYKLYREERYKAMGGDQEDFWIYQARDRYEVQSRGLDAIIEKEQAASRKMIELSERTADAMEENFSNLFFDTITGEFDSLEDYAEAVLRSIARMASDYMGQVAREALFGESGGSGGAINGLLNFVGKLFSGGSASAAAGSSVHIGVGGTTAFGMAAGGVVPGIEAYSNRVVDKPTVFPFATGGRIGLMGEAGAEAVLPLKRTASGDLGVQTGGVPVINIHNYAGADISANASSGVVDIIVRRAVAAVADDMRRGGVTASAAIGAAVGDLKSRGQLRGAIQSVT